MVDAVRLVGHHFAFFAEKAAGAITIETENATNFDKLCKREIEPGSLRNAFSPVLADFSRRLAVVEYALEIHKIG